MSKAQGQFTIIDYNDAITLTGYINANQMKTQMYNPDNATYTPDWASSNMVLTPSLFAAGSGTDIIASDAVQSVKWYDGSSATAIAASTNYALSGTKSHILTIKKNVLAGLAGKDYRCVVVYRDPTTNLDLTFTMSITLSRVVNGGGIVDLIVTTPNGNVFKNGDVSTLTAKAELWRGSTIDTTNVTYQWYEIDSTVTTDQGGGVGQLCRRTGTPLQPGGAFFCVKGYRARKHVKEILIAPVADLYAQAAQCQIEDHAGDGGKHGFAHEGQYS